MIGTDILAIERMRRLYDKCADRVVTKILHQAEYDGFYQAKDKARFLAKRWAAKEAISKALGTGIRPPILMPAINIYHDSAGAPKIMFTPEAQLFLDKTNVKHIAISISDEKEYVVAFSMVLYQ